MLVTVANQTSRIIQAPDVVDNRLTDGPADLYATGGGLTDPLPFPFDQVGQLAANGDPGASIQRAMHPSDFMRQHNLWSALPPSSEWNLIVNAGTVTFATAAEASRTDVEELFLNAV